MDTLELRTPHLRLRLLDEMDGALYRELHASPRVMARIAPVMDAASTARAFDTAVTHNGRATPGHRTWAVLEQASGRAVGIAALHRDGAAAEAGMMLLPIAWNARYSAEVMQALVRCAFDRMALERLFGICRLGPNVRMARRLLGPHGFVETLPDRPGTARWVLARGAAAPTRPVGMGPAPG